jgi:tetratricopeptide (TPR) repeat protein
MPAGPGLDAGQVNELLSAAIDAHRAGRPAEADRLYRDAVRANPADAQALRLRGILAREQGDLEASARYLGRAAEVAPGDAAPLAELALTRMAADDLDAAVALLRAALGRNPDHARALANLGALLQYRGHVLEAIACHERALALDPHDAEVRCNLAKALSEAGRGVEALALCDDGLAAQPAHPLLLGARGAVCCDLEDFPAAVDALAGAAQRNPDDDLALVSLAYAQQRLGATAAAIAALERALAINPHGGRATADHVNLLAGSGRVAEALSLAEDYLAAHPGERHVLGALGFALRDAGHAAQADALVDLEQLVLLRTLDLPADLAGRLLADPSRLASPASKATRGGEQTGELDLAGDPALRGLHAALEASVREAAASLLAAGFSRHPAMAPQSPRWSLRAWGTLLAPGGRQLPHIHPEAWLSGVLYVALPDDMARGEATAGALQFGAPPARFVVVETPPTRTVLPAVGRLVLFPSYFHHCTLPFVAAGTRVSLAFDVVARSNQ